LVTGAVWLNDGMPDETATRIPTRRHRRPLLKSFRLWVPVGVALVVAALAIVTLYVGNKALDAKRNLEAALPLASKVETQLMSGDSAGASQTAALLQQKTAVARRDANDGLWRRLEWVPVAGPNLHAVRTLSDVVDDLANHAITPASKINVAAFKPVNGRLDVQAVRNLQATVAEAKAAVGSAARSVAGIDRAGLISQVDSAVTKLDETLKKADGIISGVDGVVKVLPGALGLDGTRHYLMMFQGNSEIRALGGNPAALALVTVSNGSVKITKQLNSNDFYNARPTSVAPLDPAVQHIYGDIIGRYIPNITSTPDFPTTVKLVRAYWAEEDPTHIDGVISFDPVALSYLLKATGPVKLATGQTLTAANAVPLLLNQVYSIYPAPIVQNAFFAAAADSIFKTLMSGTGSPSGMATALTHAANEGRLLFWSENPNEEKIIATTRMAGILPTTNGKNTLVGAYFNDVTGSKMDYFMKASVAAASNQCTATTPTFTATVTLSNVLDPSKANSLPRYVTGPYYKPGNIGTDVVVYGPVGSTFKTWKANKGVTVRAKGVIAGRPVMRIWVVLTPSRSATLSYTLTGSKGAYGPLEVQTTPGVWPTPTTATMTGCPKK
jgi:hypothetical protein